jgi:hypothetical protein
MTITQGASQTGTRDETYDLVSVLYHALQGVENCQTYSDDASGDQELRRFFEDACDQQRQLADRAKQLLKQRIGGEGAENRSAFGFSQSQGSGGGQGSGI